MFHVETVSRFGDNQDEYPIPVLVTGIRRGESPRRRTFLFNLFSYEFTFEVDDFPGFDIPTKQEIAICKKPIFKVFNIQEPEIFNQLRKMFPDRSFPVSVIFSEMNEKGISYDELSL